MPVSRLHNCLFIHIPKTAGTSIEYALGMHGGEKHIGICPGADYQYNPWTLSGTSNNVHTQHYTVKQAKNVLSAKIWESMFKFTFVRNPWDRFVSAVMFNSSMSTRLDPNISMDDFKEHAKRASTKIYEDGHFRAQLDYIVDNNNKSLMDYVGRFEALHEDWDKLCKLLDVDLKLDHRMNSNNSRHYTEYYDSELKELVAKMYAPDIEYFGYEFN